jgi:hypothetical protein
MNKILIVIEDIVQARAAVSLLCDRSLDRDREVVLVCFRPSYADWQRHSWTSERERVQAAAKEQAALAVAWQLLSEAGLFYKTQIAEGEFASTVAAIANREGCNQIILSRPPEGYVSRTLFSFTGIKVGGTIERLLALADAQITVVGLSPTHDAGPVAGRESVVTP